MKAYFLALLLLPFSLFAGSVRVINDSPFPLWVVLLGADGSELSNFFMKPQEIHQWQQDSDVFSSSNYKTLTPYTAIFRCNDGTEFGIWPNIQQAATISAQDCPYGNKICRIQQSQKAGPR